MRRQIFQIFVYPALSISAWFYGFSLIAAAEEPCFCATSLCDDDDPGAGWIFEPSYFSHDPQTGDRVAQYSPTPKVYPRFDPTYQESGFRYTQQFLRGERGSFDALHLVQTWGEGNLIRPYGEWKYPYRAGATPYGPWGNPQGPWTMPFDSWVNPYGLGRLRNPPWMYNPYPMPVPYGNPYSPMMPGMGNGSESMPYGIVPDGYGGSDEEYDSGSDQ